MPQTDSSSIVVNCGTRLQGQTSLEYLVVFCETMRHTHKLSGRGSTETVIPDKAESLRIDIFELQESSRPTLDFVLWIEWGTMLAQFGIAAAPWILYNKCGVMMVALSGNFLALLTCALPQ